MEQIVGFDAVTAQHAVEIDQCVQIIVNPSKQRVLIVKCYADFLHAPDRIHGLWPELQAVIDVDADLETKIGVPVKDID